MRYFFVSYTISHPKGMANGNLFFNFPSFPPNEWIKEQILERRKGEGLSGVVLSSIFEFQNEQDYNDFRGHTPQLR